MSPDTDVANLVNKAILQEHHAITESLLAELTRHLDDHRERVLQILSTHQGMDPAPSCHEKNADMKDPMKASNDCRQGTQETEDVPGLCTGTQKALDTEAKRATATLGNQRSRGFGSQKAEENLGFLGEIVKSTSFEVASAGLIVFLLVVMCAETQYHGMNAGHNLNMNGFARPGSESWPHAKVVFDVFEYVFNIMFSMEVILRLVALKCKTLKDGWFWLDSSLVTLSWLHLLGFLNLGLDPMILRLVRLIELVRLVKVFKAFQVVDTLLLLVKSIKSSFGVLLWSFMILGVIQTATGLALSQMLGAFITDESKPVEVRRRVFQYFGTMSNSFLTMFEIIEGNWVVTCRLLYDEVNEWYGLFYILYRCCAMFAIIKVITAVFIAETNRHANSDDELALTKKQRQKEAYCAKLQSVFTELDHSGDGHLSWEELDRLINDEMMQSLLHTMEIDTNDLRYVFEALDNGDSQIDFKEFVGGLTQVRGPAKGLDVFKVLTSVGRMEHTLNKLVGDVSKFQKQSMHGKSNRPVEAYSKSQEQNTLGATHGHCVTDMESMSDSSGYGQFTV